jgi:hypothetical protein
MNQSHSTAGHALEGRVTPDRPFRTGRAEGVKRQQIGTATGYRLPTD